MITFRVTKVKDEKTLLALLDLLAKHHGVEARYLQPCLPRTYAVCIGGQQEKQFESDLCTFASQVGWLMKD